jgi:hypothetical protein
MVVINASYPSKIELKKVNYNHQPPKHTLTGNNCNTKGLKDVDLSTLVHQNPGASGANGCMCED